MQTISSLSLQQWGNSLGVRIPAVVARLAHFSLGQPVELSITDEGVLIRPAGQPKLSLSQKLALFDSKKHGGEVMLTRNEGKEKW